MKQMGKVAELMAFDKESVPIKAVKDITFYQ